MEKSKLLFRIVGESDGEDEDNVAKKLIQHADYSANRSSKERKKEHIRYSQLQNLPPVRNYPNSSCFFSKMNHTLLDPC